jgi:hypothetical protein
MLQFQETKNVIKLLSYEDLTIEIEHMGNVKTKVIPLRPGENGTISKSFRKYLSNVPGKHTIEGLQKTVILGSAHTHTLRNV